MNNTNKKGFTLIELLVVIAILAVLMVAVALILNPAELIRQGRDSTRLSDLAAVHRAIGLWFADLQEVEFVTTTGQCTYDALSPFNGACVANASTTVSGSGWVPVDFTAMSTGAPLSRLPLDPVNNADYYYAFIGNDSQEYEINANMESIRYSHDAGTNPGDNDVESTDGGDNDDWYEVGNISALNL
jgi:prepilin-type N-terminal cleavage/methylation domain-containing protein